MFKSFIILKYFHIQTSAIKGKYPTLTVRIFLVSVRTHLRANVTNGQTFGGNRSKINSAHILMLGRP